MVATDGQTLKKPITVPRPDHLQPAVHRGLPPEQRGDVSAPGYGQQGGQVIPMDPYKQGIATLMRTSKGVHRSKAPQ